MPLAVSAFHLYSTGTNLCTSRYAQTGYTKIGGIPHYVLVVELDGHCGLPKGHIESGETEMQAALREIKEETGITADIADGFLKRIEYTMRNGNRKQTTYFCARYENQSIRCDTHEILDIKLLPFNEAVQALSYPEVKAVLIEANRYIAGIQCTKKSGTHPKGNPPYKP